MSLVLYDRALLSGAPLDVQYADGGVELLPLARWRGGLDAADAAAQAVVA